MGKYINVIEGKHIGTTFTEKANQIIEAGGIKIKEPTEFVPNLVCLVDNGMFAAAAYAFDESEMNAFKHPCGRFKIWFILEGVELYAD